jgi:hypothetical protein
VISLRKGIVGIFNFAVAGLILTEVLIYALKNAQTYNGIESLTQMLSRRHWFISNRLGNLGVH